MYNPPMTRINPHIFRAYDIRGIAIREENDTESSDLTPGSCYVIGIAVGQYMKEHFGERIVVGRDNRITGPALQSAFIVGLMEAGCTVTNIGLSTSPMVYWATCALPYDGGINITASHNPKEYNGIKIVAKGAHSICGDDLQVILKMAQDVLKEKQANSTKQDIFGEIEVDIPNTKIPSEKPIAEEYITDLLLRAELYRPLKIVIDAGNATTGAFAPELFKKFGCDVTPLFCELDGNYPNHEANPEESKNMIQLAEKVLEVNADLGIAFDGDGDRVGIVDEKGNHHSADYLLLMLATDLLKRQEKAQIVFDVKVSQILISGIRDAGGIPVMSKTGHSFIETKMKEINAPLGGEISGHFFFGENYYGFDDAFLAALRLISIFSKIPEGETVSQQFEKLPRMFTTPEYKLRCPDDKKFAIVTELSKHFEKLYPCITIDGVRVNFDTSSWGAIRCSNTSPNLTARFEAPSQERLDNIKNIFLEQLKKYPEINLAAFSE